jgi:hypothetical protein
MLNFIESCQPCSGDESRHKQTRQASHVQHFMRLSISRSLSRKHVTLKQNQLKIRTIILTSNVLNTLFALHEYKSISRTLSISVLALTLPLFGTVYTVPLEDQGDIIRFCCAQARHKSRLAEVMLAGPGPSHARYTHRRNALLLVSSCNAIQLRGSVKANSSQSN